jgi:hypothetical protein
VILLDLQSAKAGQNTSRQRKLLGQTKRNGGLELSGLAGGLISLNLPYPF